MSNIVATTSTFNEVEKQSTPDSATTSSSQTQQANNNNGNTVVIVDPSNEQGGSTVVIIDPTVPKETGTQAATNYVSNNATVETSAYCRPDEKGASADASVTGPQGNTISADVTVSDTDGTITVSGDVDVNVTTSSGNTINKSTYASTSSDGDSYAETTTSVSNGSSYASKSSDVWKSDGEVGSGSYSSFDKETNSGESIYGYSDQSKTASQESGVTSSSYDGVNAYNQNTGNEVGVDSDKTATANNGSATVTDNASKYEYNVYTGRYGQEEVGA